MPLLPLALTLTIFLFASRPSTLLAAGSSVGVNATHIIIGQTAPLLADAGIRVSAGMRAAFEEANVAGGVQSRNLTVLALDDGYVTARAVANYATLLNKTLLLANVYGSSINVALAPLVEQDNMPNVGVLTGTAATRFPFREQMINFQSGFWDNMVVHAILLVERLRVQQIGCIYQDDAFGQPALSALTAALTYVGLQLAVTASYPSGSLAIEAAVEAIAARFPPVQAVVLLSLEDQSVKFLRLFAQDNRTDPDCVFLTLGNAVSSNFPYRMDPQLWPKFYFTHVVPPMDYPGLRVMADFLKAAAQYIPPNLVDHISLQTYMVARFIVQVLRGIPGEITRQAFLDEVYNTRLFDLGGVLVGMYGRNFTNCEKAVCASSIGMRATYVARLNLTTGKMRYDTSIGERSFAITELSYPVTKIVRPVLLGQLLPLDDPVWRAVAEAIGQQLQSAFAALNAAGGVDGRPVQLLQRWYSGDATAAAAALATKYPLLALVGSVVNQSSALQVAPAQIGTYQTDPLASQAPYKYTEVQVQASLALELMALASFANKLGAPVHLRAPATAAGQVALRAMVQSLNSLQKRPASSVAYAAAADALQGLGAGTVIAVGSDADVTAWFQALAALPQLRLLVPSPRAVHLLGTLNVGEYPQASRFHYPYMFGAVALSVAPGPELNDAVLYGQVLGGVLRGVLEKSGNKSTPYSTTPQVLNAVYGSQHKSNGVVLGPYYSTFCTGDDQTPTDCECNEGVRQVTVLTALRQPQPVKFTYALATCHVVYAELIAPASSGQWFIGVIAGVGVGVLLLLLLSWWVVRRGQRDNSAAPKNSAERFCIVFTDIQASTYLWATIPDIMAVALHTHHTIIRRLLAKHRLYEVKTIGDSFMCAGSSPASAVEFALHLQRELHAHDWGTDRIDTAYLLQFQDDGEDKWSDSHGGWNGLRVRVGIHYERGEVYLDPVTKGYDYYGTVVNTASRVEAVCHGGQVGITQAVYDAVKGEFPGAVLTDLGMQVLRGLGEPVHLYQLVPSELSDRAFPPLRLEYAGTVDNHGRPPGEQSLAGPYPRKAVVPDGDSGTVSPSNGVRNNAPTATSSCWVDTHPMVRSGQLTAE
eukprot:EG_transcript_1419